MSARNDIEGQAADWLARVDSDRWNADDQLQLDAWLQADARHRVAYLRLQAAWQAADRLQALAAAGAAPQAPAGAAPPHPAAAPTEQPRGPDRSRAWMRPPSAIGWRIAASLLLVIALAGGSAWHWSDRPQQYAAALGARAPVRLEDGSTLMLNTSTRVRVALDGQQRQVWLDEGEAYFDVAHDAGRPFVIHAGIERITVLGTRFVVRRDSQRVSVVVAQGMVRVEPASGAGGARPMVLAPRAKLVAGPDGATVSTVSARQLDDTLSWRRGRLVFDNVTLAEAAAEFNRYNRRQLHIGDAAAAAVRIGGSFGVDQVDVFAHLLHDSFGLRLEESDRRLTVHSVQ